MGNPYGRNGDPNPGGHADMVERITETYLPEYEVKSGGGVLDEAREYFSDGSYVYPDAKLEHVETGEEKFIEVGKCYVDDTTAVGRESDKLDRYGMEGKDVDYWNVKTGERVYGNDL